ncbi:sulfatase-like hydrolase/transferase [Fluviispira multicolorata]|uniref:Sulfatase-like hydrolase/transferase n=2 Tax=Fluviispira multicolorata TaxID=2654512 RepID=A0A833JF00_9BACT|nr:sulfatase-like hydrolase/transferase [Fluviispira multicolorata]
MLTVKKWRIFWIRYLFGSLVFFVPFFVISLIFSSGFVYLGENTSSIFLMIIKSQPKLVLTLLCKILFISWLICLGLQFITSSFKYKYKIIFGFVFFICAIIRVCSMYPAVTENWIIVQNSNFIRNIIQNLSTLHELSRRKTFAEWLPFIALAIAFFINLIIHMKYLILQSRVVKKARSSIQVDELDLESRIFSIQGVSFVIFFIFGTIFLFNMNSSLKINLPQNNTQQNRPNVFIFASDSLRYDRLFEKKYENIMPFLKSKIKEAELFKPMLVGVPRTFPSWVEIATGVYSSNNGVRTMFPSRNTRLGKKQTIFETAKESGYSTIFVSDFAGDIFPRYPFGADEINAPTSNLQSMVENGIISGLSAIQAILTLPNMQRIIPSLLESPEISDPRLVAKAFSESLTHVAQISRPVFITTFFSTAHFPYAAPGPWYSKFQEKDANGNYKFRKNPDQNVLGSNVNQNISEISIKQTISLYDGGLNAIDNTLKDLMHELETKGWLKNSIILFFGDHGENLYEGNLGMGHGDGVAGEYSNVTPLIILTKGNTVPIQSQKPIKNLVRTIDIAPTIARRINVRLPEQDLDGEPLLDLTEKLPNFPTGLAYMETGIWFTTGKLTPENQPRIIYPGVTSLLDIDEGMNFEFYVRPSYSQAIPGVKERAWVNDIYKLIARTTPYGVQTSLYFRSDKASENDLLFNPENIKTYKPIAMEMLNQMNKYLLSRGVEIVPNGKGSFFYSENISQ